MHEQEWFVMHKPMPAAQPAAEPAAVKTEVAQGGASTIGQAVTVTTGSGLEVLDQAEIDLRKEELVVGKREVSNGGVLVRTVVQTEPVSETVELRREEFVIERIPAGSTDQQARSGSAFLGREIYIPLMREEAISGKRTVLTEVVRLGKKIETDRQTISAPVRSEDVEIVKNPNLSDPKFSAVPRRAPTGLTTYTETGTASQPATEGALRLAREQFVVGKQEVDSGGVYLQKVIRTETASQPIELQREEYVVERTPISGEAPGADFSARQITLGLKREEAVAGTRNYVAETIRVKKQMHSEQQIVSGAVRKEAVEIVKLAEPAAAMGGTSVSSQSGTAMITETSCEMTRDQLLSKQVEEGLAKRTDSGPAYTNIDAIAADGVVTLKGTVGSRKEKSAIGKRVKNMSGVRSVDNQLEIETP
jgi:uncharacterized protein (TIGR02271 family)